LRDWNKSFNLLTKVNPDVENDSVFDRALVVAIARWHISNVLRRLNRCRLRKEQIFAEFCGFLSKHPAGEDVALFVSLGGCGQFALTRISQLWQHCYLI
jgi:hypothetical protein